MLTYHLTSYYFINFSVKKKEDANEKGKHIKHDILDKCIENSSNSYILCVCVLNKTSFTVNDYPSEDVVQ